MTVSSCENNLKEDLNKLTNMDLIRGQMQLIPNFGLYGKTEIQNDRFTESQLSTTGHPTGRFSNFENSTFRNIEPRVESQISEMMPLDVFLMT